MPTTFTLAHLSDPHLGPLVGFRPRQWRLKRLTGFVNWHRNRRHEHLPETLAAIVADMRRQAPDHIAVTGDLANLGLPLEIANALTWLERLGPPGQVSVVPGNHDIYVPFRRDPGVERWADYMTSNAAGAAFTEPAAGPSPGPSPDPSPGPSRFLFPSVRRFGPIALIGVNSAVPMPPFVAAGRVGLAQCARLAHVLRRLGDAGLVRVVLIHHPPLRVQASATRGLQDAVPIERLLAQHGAELVLHGHLHVASLHWWPGPTGPIPIVGVPSASMGAPRGHDMLARYNLYRIEVRAAPDGPPSRVEPSRHEPSRIEVIERGLPRPGGTVVEIARRSLDRTDAG